MIYETKSGFLFPVYQKIDHILGVSKNDFIPGNRYFITGNRFRLLHFFSLINCPQRNYLYVICGRNVRDDALASIFWLSSL